MSNIYGRAVILPLTNKSGGGVIAGDVVVVDTTNNDAFTTSTAGAVTIVVGVAQETIANNVTGRVLLSGYAALVNVNASVTRGHYGKTHTVAKQATDAGTSRTVGTFCQFLTGGTTPDAVIYPPDLTTSSGNVATDTIWDAKGDLAGGTGADTAARLAVGANNTILMADSSQTTGLKWFALASTEATLGGNVTMGTFGTWYDGPSMTIAAGTWLISGRVAVNASPLGGGGYAFVAGRVNSGGTIVQESETITNQAGGTVSVYFGMFPLVLGSSTTVKLQAMDPQSTATMLRDIQNGSSTTHTASYLHAFKIA